MSVVSPPPVRVRADQQRLRGGALGLLDIAGSTMANIGPAMSFYFSFGFLATASGLASPLTIVAAGVAVALLGNTLAQFSRAHPSAGSFVTFVGTTFGGASAVATALLAALGYIIGISAVIAVSGGFLATTLEYYAGWSPPWVVWTLVLTAASAALIVRGIVLSTKVAGFFFAVELVDAAGGVGLGDRQARRAPVGGAVPAEPYPGRDVRAGRGVPAWRCTYSSAGRTRRRWRRRARIRGGMSGVRCSPRSR